MFRGRIGRLGARAVGLAGGGGAFAAGQQQLRAHAEAPKGEGGVLPDFRKKGLAPRAVQPLSPPRHDFFSKEIVALGVPIRAHASVSDGALVTAADRLSRMLRHLPTAVLERLEKRGAAFHVIGVGQGTSDLPEHAHMKGVDGGYTGEKGVTLDQRTRGMGGVQSSCGEENLIDLDADPRYAGRDILTHEFAHCIMDVGLPRALQDEIRATHRRAVETEGRWQRADGKGVAYAGSNASEYFAELTMWCVGICIRLGSQGGVQRPVHRHSGMAHGARARRYFGSHGEFADRERRLPTPGPGGLAAYDPDGFALLASIYGGTHPRLAEADPLATRVPPLDVREASSGASVDEPEVEAELVQLEFDNRGCDCTWRLYWLDPHGQRAQYGEVPPDGLHVQGTFPGHVWSLEAATGAAAAKASELRYSAAKSACVASVTEDARCGRMETRGAVAASVPVAPPPREAAAAA